MKTIKKLFLLTFIACLTTTLSFAQKAYMIHQDNVKPSMVWEYESIAKEFNEACKKHNPDTSWITVQAEGFVYMYVTPMESFADMDKNPFKDMAKAMGDEWKSMFNRFDKCYDSHGNYVVRLDEELTYMPDGISQTQEGQNFRDYFYIYYKPENSKKVKEGMKAIKEMYVNKGSKSYYRIYHSGFGQMESYYLVAMSSKDEIDSAQKSKANEELLGPERFDVFKKLMSHVERMESTEGRIRTDLAYKPNKE